jgi:hypothetical protein
MLDSMTPEIASLMSDVSFWEFCGYIALAAVLIGVIGESIKEFTDWLERIGWEKKISRLSALILIAGLAGEVITQPKTNAVNATLIAFLNKQSGQLAIDLEKERANTSARPWTKEQFAAIQEIKGIVTDVGIIVEDKCLECRSYATFIERALNEAGVTLHGEDVWFGDNWGGIIVYVPTPPNAPNWAEILSNHPLIKALTKGAIQHVATNFLNCAECRKDIPVIEVGAIQKQILTMPYSPNGQRSWTKLPLKK